MRAHVAFTLSEADERRFWSKVALPDGNGCMLWLASFGYGGYGKLRVQSTTVRAHRLALWIAVGPPNPADAEAAHSCRNRHCVAPDHLRWATKSENQADRLIDGTHNRGDRSGQAKLTWAKAQEIREKAAAGNPIRSIAKEYGIHHSQVSRIATGQSWITSGSREVAS